MALNVNHMFRWLRSGVLLVWLSAVVAGTLLILAAAAVAEGKDKNVIVADSHAALDDLAAARTNLQAILAASDNLPRAGALAAHAAQQAAEAAADSSGRSAAGFDNLSQLLTVAASAADNGNQDLFDTALAASAAQSDQLIMVIGARSGTASREPSGALATAPVSAEKDRMEIAADSLGWPELDVPGPQLSATYEQMLERFLAPDLPTITAADLTNLNAAR